MALRTIEPVPPPHSLEAERTVLGTCLLKPDVLRDMDLTRDDFFGESHSRIWSALQFLAAEGTPVDTVTLRDRLMATGQLASVGGDDYLLGLTDLIPTLENAAAYASIVRKLARQRGVQALGRRLARAGQDGDLAEAQTAVREAQRALDEADHRPTVEWRTTLDVFAPLPPVPWRVRGLQICPGRPSVFVGYGASAKTLSAQSMALACATGRPVWEFFQTEPMVVRHLDYEQGWHATARRYQRLAYGHGIDPREVEDRLKVAVFPRLFLDAPNADDAYAKLCDGAELVILDSFKAATPTQDENDNGIRICVDVLTRVSEKTGCAFLMLHHAGKTAPGERDARAMGRGASSIFDAAGSWFNFVSGPDKADARTIKQAKQPAEAEGMGVQDFLLDVLDVHAPGQLAAGVRVLHRAIQEPDPVAVSSARYDAHTGQLLAIIRRYPGLGANEIVARSGLGRTTSITILESLRQKGVLRVSEGARKSLQHYLADSHNTSSETDG